MPVQTTQATLAAISARLSSMDETLKQILAKVPEQSPKPATPSPK